MSREYQAILFDTRSIQRFIFTGTRLKTNIGASYLVDQAFERVLLPVVRQVLGEEALDDTTWREVPLPDWTVQECAARVGYIGGGNALLLVRTDVSAEQVREIVRAFTKRLLVWAPGLRTGAAIGRLCLEADGSYAEGTGLSALVHALKEGQSTLFPAVVPPYFGITQACPVSGNTADAYDSSAHRFYSQEVAAKLRVATRTGRAEAPAEEELVRKLRVVLPTEQQASFLDGFTFPKEFEHLGQAETENYIAIVHVDGNNMGRQFMACDTLTKRKNLSRHVRQWTLEAFASLVSSVTEHFEAYDFLVCARDEEGRRYLPLRPIVLGGDDCTFVCAAKVAFPFTQKLMEEMAARGIKSCGGIAILKTAYPFFRGYEMAESLCGAAKARMRATDNDSCWLDFALLHGEQPPTLEEMRALEYRGVCGDLHFGPYCVDGSTTEKSLDDLLAAVHWLKRMPQSKAKELRRVLARGREEQQQFLAQLRYLAAAEKQPGRLQLPHIRAWKAYEQALFAQDASGRSVTPYVDAIELMDFLEMGEREEA